MSTDAQIRANRANSQFSTGPRTPEGKSASAANAFRHGFRSQSVLLPGDDPAEYQQLLDELTTHYLARNLTETRFVREMADAEWRLRRARLHQEHLLTSRIEELAGQPNASSDPIALQVRAHEDLTANSAYFRQLTRYEEKFERQYDRAVRGWLKYQAEARSAASRDLDNALKRSLIAPPPEVRAPRPSQAPVEIDTNEANPVAGYSRNAPCPCGSGFKFKRCCARFGRLAS